MKPYQPSQIVPAQGAILLLAVILIGGALTGALVALVDNLFYLIFVFPFFMGVVGGALAAFAVRAGKIRNPGVAWLGGLLMGLVIFAAMWVVNYLQFASSLPIASAQPDFFSYAQVEAQKGEAVLRLGSLELLNLGAALTWIYWALELVLIAWLSARAGQAQARQPFSELCNCWFGTPELLGTLGSSRQKEVVGLVENGHFEKLGEELQSNPALPNLGVFLAACERDCSDGDSFLAVSRQTRSSRGRAVASEIVSGLISSSQVQEMRSGIETRRALYGLDSTPIRK